MTLDAPTHGSLSVATDVHDYPAIEDYAVIGDCRTVALISRQGSIDWLCLPYYSGSTVFAALLDRQKGGRFAIRPAVPFRTQRHYIDNTNVLETTFISDHGKVRLIDCMPLSGTPDDRSLEPQREVLRLVEGVEGNVEVEFIFQPRFDYARVQPKLKRRGALGWTCQHRSEIVYLLSDVALELDPEVAALNARITVSAGDKHYLSLTYTQHDIAVIAPLGQAAEARLHRTVRWWEDWIGRCDYRGPWRTTVIRSILTLKLLTYALSGAVVAAATSSLPESMGGPLNWDYRYCWLRDASLTLRSFLDLGYETEGDTFFSWLIHATRLTRPELRVLYDVYGKSSLTEQKVDHLEGYRRSQPVYLGNGAKDQLQLDVYGTVVLAARDFVDRGGAIDRTEGKVLTDFGKTVCKKWREPDNGIWEMRGQRRHYTLGKAMCWIALDNLIRLADDAHLRIPRKRFIQERDAIQAVVDSQGFNRELNSFVQVLDGAEPDASLLLLARYGYCQPDDPRMMGTYEYIERALGLGHKGLLYRYQQSFESNAPEGTFGICGFWAVDYLARCGQIDKAVQRFDHLLSFSNDVGLFAEEIDPVTGAALGNFPQAFTHVGLIAAALTLVETTTPTKQS